MSQPLTLAHVLQRGISLEWHEAVAVVRSVAECLLDRPQVVPELHQIEILPTGRVNVLGGTSSDEAVRRFGQLLQATLAQSDPPVQLRLVISQATAPAPILGSVRELDQALEYYERPDRSAVIRDLYVRAAAVASPLDSGPTPTLDVIAPLSAPGEPRHTKSRATASKRRLSPMVVVAAGFLVICAAGLGLTGAGSIGLGIADVSAMTGRGLEAVGAVLRSGLSSVAERIGLGRLVWSNATDAGVAPADPPPSPARPADRQLAAGRPSPLSTAPPVDAPATDFPIEPTASLPAFDLAPAPAAPATPHEAPVETTPANEPADEEPAGDGALTIYSTDSAEVSPPVGVRPQIPQELPPGLRQEDIVSIELVVLPDGTVGSVRLLGQLRYVHDLMWLSAIKAWQFRPAMKDGVAVSFRKTVSIGRG
jgi:hypothetical protein